MIRCSVRLTGTLSSCRTPPSPTGKSVCPISNSCAARSGLCSTAAVPAGAIDRRARVCVNEPSCVAAADRYFSGMTNFGSGFELDRTASTCGAVGSRHDFFGSVRDQLLPSAQRHDAVAAGSDLPAAQGLTAAQFRSGRADHRHLSVHRVDASAARRTLCGRRPLPFSLPAGMVSTLIGLLLLSVSHTYPMLIASLCSGWTWICDLSPGIRPGGADGLRRPIWVGAVTVPGRR